MLQTADVMLVDLPGLRHDGKDYSSNGRSASVPAPSGPIFVMIVRDRSAIDWSIEALRASEERFRLLVEGVDELRHLHARSGGPYIELEQGS